MSRDRSGVLHRQIEGLFRHGSVAGVPDQELLDRFAEHRDSQAFSALVERHGPMVFGVCRRILGDRHAAEDAFQATFLIMVRKAGTIRVDPSLGRWLYTVTRRVALRARSESARLARQEPYGDEPLLCARVQEAEGREWQVALHEELGHLPESQRTAVVLCYLEGMTHEEAARHLGWPLGTVKGRLSRARALLRARLTRRGFGLTTATLVACLRPRAVSAVLLDETVSVAMGIANGRALITGGGPAAWLLAKGVLDRMFMVQMKLAATALLGVGLTVGFTTVGVHRLGNRPAVAASVDDQAVPPKAPGAPDQKRLPDLAKKRAFPKYVVEPPDVLDVEVRGDLSGRPISGERLVRPDGKISLGFYGELQVAGLTTLEIKEKLIRHLRQFLSDESLGLKKEQQKEVVEVAPRDSALVTVTVQSFNSKGYYVQGEIAKPGRYPMTGNETVLDAINQAGGLLATTVHMNIRLVRPAPPGACCEETFPVDLSAIVNNGDASTNYQLMPGDRLLVMRDPKEAGGRARRSRREVEAQIDAIIRQLESLKREIGEDSPLP